MLLSLCFISIESRATALISVVVLPAEEMTKMRLKRNRERVVNLHANDFDAEEESS